jgi:hypothetical protein
LIGGANRPAVLDRAKHTRNQQQTGEETHRRLSNFNSAPASISSVFGRGKKKRRRGERRRTDDIGNRFLTVAAGMS